MFISKPKCIPTKLSFLLKAGRMKKYQNFANEINFKDICQVFFYFPIDTTRYN